MLRKLITTSLVLALLPVSTAFAQWGTLTGRFVYDGEAPAPPAVNVTKDQAFCGKHDLKDPTIRVNPDDNGLQNVVLYLYLSRGKKAPTPHPDYAKTANAKVTLDNLNCEYVPHIALLRTTQTLVVGNKDSVGHNTKIDTLKNVPINPIIPANGQIEKQFKNEERLPTLVTCSIHPWMNARVLIKDSPYMAVTDENGKFTIENLPQGEWTFQVWHEASGYIDEVNLAGKKTQWRRGRFEFAVGDGENDMGDIKVSPKLLEK